MNRAVLGLQTVYSHDADRDEARRLRSDLYEQLTRPISDPLAFGLHPDGGWGVVETGNRKQRRRWVTSIRPELFTSTQSGLG